MGPILKGLNTSGLVPCLQTTVIIDVAVETNRILYGQWIYQTSNIKGMEIPILACFALTDEFISLPQFFLSFSRNNFCAAFSFKLMFASECYLTGQIFTSNNDENLHPANCE